MSPLLIALVLTLGMHTPAPAITAVDTIQVTARSLMAVDDVLEAVALKAGIVKQGDRMRL